MATNVYSARFLALHAGANDHFTCPPGFLAVVKCVTAFNANALLPFKAQLLHQPSNATIVQWSNIPGSGTPGGDSQTWLGTFTFRAGESIVSLNDLSIDMTVSGYLLSLP